MLPEDLQLDDVFQTILEDILKCVAGSATDNPNSRAFKISLHDRLVSPIPSSTIAKERRTQKIHFQNAYDELKTYGWLSAPWLREEVEQIDRSRISKTVMQGLAAADVADLWTESERRFADEWRGQLAAPGLQVYRERLENMAGREGSLYAMEVIICGILLSRGEQVDFPQ